MLRVKRGVGATQVSAVAVANQYKVRYIHGFAPVFYETYAVIVSLVAGLALERRTTAGSHSEQINYYQVEMLT